MPRRSAVFLLSSILRKKSAGQLMAMVINDGSSLDAFCSGLLNNCLTQDIFPPEGIRQEGGDGLFSSTMDLSECLVRKLSDKIKHHEL